MEISERHEGVHALDIVVGFFNGLLVLGAFLLALLGTLVIVLLTRGTPAWMRGWQPL